MYRFRYNERGFTLIELLVVIAIIGTLASVVLASLNSAREKGRDAKRLSEAREIQKALEAYYSDNGFYPESSWSCSSADWPATGGGDISAALAEYFPNGLPSDPINESSPAAYSGGLNYCYYARGYGDTSNTSNRWYMLVIPQEGPNTEIDARDGVLTCDGQFFNYDNEDGYILTLGGSCI
ncbi:MAG: type II secretion system protein [Candidatus Paceibacterota bacterium]